MTTVTAGICTCGKRVLRTTTDPPATTDIHPVNAALELRAWAEGRPSYTLGWKAGMTLTRRTDADIKTKPAGFTTAHIVLTHQCTTGSNHSE